MSPADPPPAAAAEPAGLRRLVLRTLALAPAGERRGFVLGEGTPVVVVGASTEDPLAAVITACLRERGMDARLVAADAPADDRRPGGLVLVAPPGPVPDAFVRDALLRMKGSASSLRKNGGSGGALLASVSRMDGRFGLSEAGPGEGAEGGALAGLVKTARHEWPEVRCRALDVDAAADPAAMAALVAAELLAEGPVEVGLSRGGAVSLEMVAEPSPPGEPVDPPLSEGDLVVVSGGGRGVTAEVAVALARRFRCRLLLLGRSAVPDDGEEPWLRPLADEAAVKRELVARSGGKPSPRDIEASWRRIAGSREIRDTLARVREAGGTADYVSVDGRDAGAVAAAVASARSLHGPVRGVVHGAGVLADGLIEQKSAEGFDRVWSTKVDGLRALLAAAGDDDLRLLLLFSSTTARLGRKGQSDYAAANEALNKMARAEAVRRPRCRVLAAGYGPWDGGMVTPSLARVFEEEGVARIPLAEGAAFTAAECAAAVPLPGPVEMVVLAGPVPGAAPVPSPAAAEPMEDAFERRLDLDSHGFLTGHVLDGRAVVPLAVMVEWLAHAALHRNPGQVFTGLEDLRVLKGILLEPGRGTTITVRAGRAVVRPDGARAVSAEVGGTLAGSGRPVLHLRATVVLRERHASPPAAAAPPAVAASHLQPATIYDEDLFHGDPFRAITAVEGLGEEGIVLRAAAAPPPSTWIQRPLRGSWLADPLALDAAFQGLIVWSRRVKGVPSLPTGAARYTQYRRAFPADGVRILARVTAAKEHRALADIDFLDAAGAVVARLEGYDCVLDASLAAAFRRRTLEP